jgi:hypothetical protein
LKQYLFRSVTAALLLLSACRGAATPEVPAATPPPYPGPAPALPDRDPYPVRPTPTSLPAPYPSLEEPAPTSTPPAQATLAAADQPVPAGTDPAGEAIWLLRPWGIQCEEPAGFEYRDVHAAAAALDEAGIEVLAAESVELMVCQACGCATSEHFRVLIPAAGLSQALDLGWMQE